VGSVGREALETGIQTIEREAEVKLSELARKAIPKSEFGLPGKRAYPVNDRSHAANAKARASQQYNAGKLSASGKAKVDAAANRKLGKRGA
jgi:hypothetical protein